MDKVRSRKGNVFISSSPFSTLHHKSSLFARISISEIVQLSFLRLSLYLSLSLKMFFVLCNIGSSIRILFSICVRVRVWHSFKSPASIYFIVFEVSKAARQIEKTSSRHSLSSTFGKYAKPVCPRKVSLHFRFHFFTGAKKSICGTHTGCLVDVDFVK